MARNQSSSEFRRNLNGFFGGCLRQEILEEIFEKNLWPMARNLFNIPISLKYFLRSRNILKKRFPPKISSLQATKKIRILPCVPWIIIFPCATKKGG